MSEEQNKLKLYPEFYDYPLPFDPREGIDVFSPTEIAPDIPDIDNEFKTKNSYINNTKLMRSDVKFPYTKEQLDELQKCSDDVIYFIVNYCKIITLKGGIELFKMFQYQKNAIKVVHENRFSIFKFPRQMGKCADGDTIVNVRINGDHLKLTIEELYNLIEVENKVDSYTPNYDYEILTSDGFKDFDGITIKKSDHLLELTLDDGSKFRLTKDHEIKLTDGEFIKAIDLKIGDIIGEGGQHLCYVQELTGSFEVADLIFVEDTHSFSINGIVDIRESCVNDDNMVTLFDNNTGEIIEVPFDKLEEFIKNNP